MGRFGIEGDCGGGRTWGAWEVAARGSTALRPSQRGGAAMRAGLGDDACGSGRRRVRVWAETRAGLAASPCQRLRPPLGVGGGLVLIQCHGWGKGWWGRLKRWRGCGGCYHFFFFCTHVGANDLLRPPDIPSPARACWPPPAGSKQTESTLKTGPSNFGVPPTICCQGSGTVRGVQVADSIPTLHHGCLGYMAEENASIPHLLCLPYEQFMQTSGRALRTRAAAERSSHYRQCKKPGGPTLARSGED